MGDHASDPGRVFVIGVVGPSGSGKSSLSHALAHVLRAGRVIGEDDYHNTTLPPGQSYAGEWCESCASERGRDVRVCQRASGRAGWLTLPHSKHTWCVARGNKRRP